MSAVEFILYPNTRLEFRYSHLCCDSGFKEDVFTACLNLLGVHRQSEIPYFTVRHPDFAPEYVYVVRLVVIFPNNCVHDAVGFGIWVPTSRVHHLCIYNQ